MENMENEIIFIKLDDIIPNRFQPREVFDEVALNELADSIRQHGVIQPIVVRQVGNKYEIIAGERRYKASALAGLTKIPAIIKNLDDKESSIVAYIENAQRRNVSAIEEARTSERILKTNNMTQEQLARELGISQSALANKLRLLSLPMEVQEALMKNEISERHARSLLSVKEPEKQIELLNKVKLNRMTVRELDGEIKNMYGNNQNDNEFGGMFINNVESQFVPTNNIVNQQDVNNNFNVSNPTFNQPISTFENNFGIEDNVSVSNNAVENSSPINNVAENVGVENNDFLNFASNFDPTQYEKNYSSEGSNSNINDSVVPVVNQVPEQNNSFLNFLNDYDAMYGNDLEVNENVVDEIPEQNIGINNVEMINQNNNVVENTNNNDTFLNFLNNYQDDSLNETVSSSVDVASNINNPVINEVVPPITSNFNVNPIKYVEDDVRYEDITKPDMLNSIDDIINELKVAVNKIKNSKFKIDTDEINFDDIYQITIKIDKRDIL